LYKQYYDAVAVILTGPDIAKKLSCDYALIKAIVMAVEAMTHGIGLQRRSRASRHRKSREMAYKMAGIENLRKQLNFGIVHDYFTITELINYQGTQLCKPGEGAKLIRMEQP
jgi:acetyl-CoA acetyltransferase